MMPAGIELASPAWLWLYPLLVLAYLFWKKFTPTSAQPVATVDSLDPDIHVYHPQATMLQTGSVSRVATGSLLRTLVVWLVIGLITVALAQPVRIGKQLPDPLPQRDIIFIVDASVSMTLRDYIVDGQRVSRMTVVKGVLDEFVKNLQGSHLSLVVFGEQAYTFVPLTADHDFVGRMIARMEPTMAGRFNAMGDGIALAVNNALQQDNRHSVLVLLTDADRETGSITPANAATLAKQAGLPLYTVAIGAATPEAEEKRITGLIYQPVNLELLKSISDSTGARSYRAGATVELKDAINDIERREKREVQQPPRYFQSQLYPWFLLPALLLLAGLAMLKPLTRCRK